MRPTFLLAGLSMLATACASTDDGPPGTVVVQEYRTGSNIPSKVRCVPAGYAALSEELRKLKEELAMPDCPQGTAHFGREALEDMRRQGGRLKPDGAPM